MRGMRGGRWMDSFDTDVAMMVGVHAAVLFDDVLEDVRASGSPKVDGRRWVRCGIAGFMDMHPYLSFGQTRIALGKLEDSGLLVSRQLEKRWGDCTKWYALGPAWERLKEAGL